MKKFFLCCLFTAVSLMAMTQSPLHIVTFNIRWDNPGDTPNHWQDRREKVAGQLLFHQADIAGIQEALHHQVTDLLAALPGYSFTGRARDDGKEKGEYSCIFFNTRRLELQQSQTFWLSLNPTIPGSKSWDAAITRVVTWARFKHKQTGEVFYAFNTHFDHMGKQARYESAKMLLKAVDSIAGRYPAVITGDFNAHPADEPIMLLTGQGSSLADSKGLSETGHYGPDGTFNGFGSKEVSDLPIDYIFLKGKWKVMQHATLSQTWGGRFSSDHFPVFARLMLLKN